MPYEMFGLHKAFMTNGAMALVLSQVFLLMSVEGETLLEDFIAVRVLPYSLVCMGPVTSATANCSISVHFTAPLEIQKADEGKFYVK